MHRHFCAKPNETTAELGVDFPHIRAKVAGVLNITKTIGGFSHSFYVVEHYP